MTAAFSCVAMTTASFAAAMTTAALVDHDDMLDRHGVVVAACGSLCLSSVSRRGFLDLKGLWNSGRVGGAEDDRREREGNEEEHAGAARRESHAGAHADTVLRRTNAALATGERLLRLESRVCWRLGGLRGASVFVGVV